MSKDFACNIFPVFSYKREKRLCKGVKGMRRILFCVFCFAFVLSQAAYAMDHERYTSAWVDDKEGDLLSAKSVVIFPMEYDSFGSYDDFDRDFDDELLRAARSALPQWTWSVSINSSNGRSGEELAAELNGQADLFVVPQVIWHERTEGRTDPYTAYIDCCNKVTDEYNGNTHVIREYHHNEPVQVPAAHEVLYRAEVSYVGYNRKGVPVLGSCYRGNGGASQSREGWRDVYEKCIRSFFKDDFLPGVQRVRMQPNVQPALICQ